MSKTIKLVLLLCGVVCNSFGQLSWSDIDSLDGDADTQLLRVKASVSGGYLVHSYITYGSLDFPNGSLEKTEQDSIYLFKVEENGNLSWAIELSQIYADFTEDADGNVFITGGLNPYTNTNFVNDVEYQTPDYTDSDIFVAMLNSSGEFQWVRQYGGHSNEYSNNIAVNDQGEVWTVVGVQSFSYTGIGPVFNDQGFALVSYDLEGNLVNEFEYEGPIDCYMLLDGTNAILGGGFNEIEFNNTLYTISNDDDNSEVFLASINLSDGSADWVKTYPTEYVLDEKIYKAPDGGYIMTGHFGGKIGFTEVIIDKNSANFDDPRYGHFAVKFDNSGEPIWQQMAMFAFIDWDKIFTYGGDTPESSGIDNEGNVYLTGLYVDTVYVDGKMIANDPSQSGKELYLAAFSDDGNVIDLLKAGKEEAIIYGSSVVNTPEGIRIWASAGGWIDFGTINYVSWWISPISIGIKSLLTPTSDFISTNEVLTYPVPNNGDFNISIGEGEIISANLVNNLGEVVSDIDRVYLGNMVTFSKVPAGMYYIRVESSMGQYTGKVVVCK